MKTFEESLAEYMQDPEFKKEWDALEPEFQIIRAIIEGREARHMTQAGTWPRLPASTRPTSAVWKTPPPTHPCAPSSGWPPALG